MCFACAQEWVGFAHILCAALRNRRSLGTMVRTRLKDGISTSQTSRDVVMRRPSVRNVRADTVRRMAPRASTLGGPLLGSLPASVSMTIQWAIAGIITASEADSAGATCLRLKYWPPAARVPWSLTSINATGLML
jgi:hypothetical protein